MKHSKRKKNSKLKKVGENCTNTKRLKTTTTTEESCSKSISSRKLGNEITSDVHNCNITTENPVKQTLAPIVNHGKDGLEVSSPEKFTTLSNPITPESDPYDTFVNLLISCNRLKRILHFLIQQAHGFVEDPIAHVTLRFLSEPIQISLFFGGCALFKSDPTIILPFRVMKSEELDALCKLLQDAETKNTLFMCEQRGGANSVILTRPQHKCIKARQGNVLAVVNHLMKPMKTHFGIDVANVVIQRLLSSSKVTPTEVEWAKRITL